MKTREQIEAKLRQIEADERLGYKTATVFENAPLALVQTSLKAQRDILKWVLEKPKK